MRRTKRESRRGRAEGRLKKKTMEDRAAADEEEGEERGGGGGGRSELGWSARVTFRGFAMFGFEPKMGKLYFEHIA